MSYMDNNSDFGLYVGGTHLVCKKEIVGKMKNLFLGLESPQILKFSLENLGKSLFEN